MKDTIKLLILPGVLLAGIVAQQAGYIDLTGQLEKFEAVAQLWWMMLLVVLIQAVLYAFALPGSLLVISLAAVYPPWVGTMLVVAGGLLGALAAYYFSAWLSPVWTARIARFKGYQLLKQNSGFFQLFALRCFPGFPHSIINYSSGILKVKLGPFVLSTALGYAFKGYIYCSAVYHATHIQESSQAISFATLLPLFFLVAFSMMGIWGKKALKL
ncbi:TVP38/TMEM64 family protein [Desulfobulbus alkaliphilus]|uniref:TVP38/TMEM64 family protein n=1 Tax=Desulfobulbus alkaliphilus TaxID=869814 RepID=UPI001963734C|nr:VTT domain-containing protein [Desulfobulbus alkaliphilus]MBM9535613.1 VTT domain-containing protein [Desulfobulbus alkaliphilus]